MSATTGPARSILRELAIDFVFGAGASRHASNHVEHVWWMWTGPDRAKKYFHLTVQLVYSFLELDVPAAQRSANHDATFHTASIAEMPRIRGHGVP